MAESKTARRHLIRLKAALKYFDLKEVSKEKIIELENENRVQKSL